MERRRGGEKEKRANRGEEEHTLNFKTIMLQSVTATLQFFLKFNATVSDCDINFKNIYNVVVIDNDIADVYSNMAS